MATFEVIKDPEVAKLICFSMGKLNPEAKDQLEFKCFEREEKNIEKTKKTVIKAEAGDMKYSGQNFGPSNHFSTDICDYYLAVHRKGASKVQVVPAQLFLLNPEFEDEKRLEDEDQSEMSYADKRKSLIQTFGSGQIQRKLLQSERKEMKEGMLSQTTEGMAAKVLSNSSFVEQQMSKNKTSSTGTPLSTGPWAIATSVAESTAIPPINKNAVTPDEVYSIRDIIPLWARGALEEESQVFVNCSDDDIKQWREQKTYPEVVLTALERQSKGHEERSEACIKLIYLHFLLHSYGLPVHQLRKKDHYPEAWKGEVKKLLDEMYTVEILNSNRKYNRNRPKPKKDLMVSHILVICLKLSAGHVIDLQPLMGPLKLNFNAISLHCKLLGCRISGNTATLSLPLTFPQLRAKKEKR